MGEIKDYITYPEDRGSINISEDVIAAVVGNAVLEVDGVTGLYTTPGRDIAEMIGKKGLAKGVKLTMNENELDADVFITAEMGASMTKVGSAVQDSVSAAVEAGVGLKVNSVNVHICGVTLKKR